MPHSLFDKLFNKIYDYLKTAGINPNYTLTLIIVAPTIYFLWKHRDEIKSWEELDYLNKLSFVTAFAVVFGGLWLLLLTILGVIKE